jgi:NADH-quinone oxidoreductase subunit A
VNAISGFGTVLLFLVGGLMFVLVTLLVGRVLRPNRPNAEKQVIYESGEDPAHGALGRFNVRFYVVALVFLLFEAELVFLFPWAIVFGDGRMIKETNGLWGVFALIEAFIFIGVLALGLAYAWRNGMLDWVKPKPKQSDFKSPIPSNAYERYR